MASEFPKHRRFANCTLCDTYMRLRTSVYWDSLCETCVGNLRDVERAPLSLSVDVSIPAAVLELITEWKAREYCAVALGVREAEVFVALPDLNNIEVKDMLRFVLNRELCFVQADSDWIQAMIDRHYGPA